MTTKAKEKSVGQMIFTKGEWEPISRFGKQTDGDPKDKKGLGGKGAALAALATLLPKETSPGFTVTTDTCRRFRETPAQTMTFLMFRVVRELKAMAKELGYMPLFSCRSGAEQSMPGMMDTILNLGLTDANLPTWEKRVGKKNAQELYRRLIEMFANVVHGAERKEFEGLSLEKAKVRYKILIGAEFPQSIKDQCAQAIEAVFKSWDNDRAKHYRKMNGISDEGGTAVNIQSMVFGNLGDTSGTGVLFTRNPLTGEDKLFGDWLMNAQGEDVVAGTRTPLPLAEMSNPTRGGGMWKGILARLQVIAGQLEEHYGDMQDIEFTVEEGKLFILQTRNGKRTSQAAFKIAVDLQAEGRIGTGTALLRVTPEDYANATKDSVDPSFKTEPKVTGAPACPGFARGRIAKSVAFYTKWTEPTILVTHDTCPDDIAGMEKAVGIVTEVGGATSHAAVVARAMNTPTVVGAAGATKIPEGSMVTIDGATGRVWVDVDVPVVQGASDPNVAKMVEWGYECTGALRNSAQITCNRMVVNVTEWLAIPKPMVTASLKKLKAMKDRSGIVLDVRTTEGLRHEEDNLLWKAFGDEKASTEEISVLIDRLVKAKAEGAVVKLDKALAGHADRLKEVGYAISCEVSTLPELLSATGPVTVADEFITEVAGGEIGYAKLKKLFKDAGRPITPLPKSMTPEQIVAEVFGGGS
jgi:phosphoenolpyruvate synthase/pyruvate phosphate dikinase